MSVANDLIKAMSPAVASIVGKLLEAITSSPNPQDAAQRALAEAARGVAFNEALRKRSKKAGSKTAGGK